MLCRTYLSYIVIALIISGCSGNKTIQTNNLLLPWGEAPYYVGPDDELRVSVLGEQELTNTYRVNSKGQISMPLIGPVGVGGQTTNQIASRIEAQLAADYIRTPHVAVQVNQFRPFFVSGEVQQSNQFPFFSGVTVRRAIAMAGGYNEFADKRYARITRMIQGRAISGEVHLDFQVYPGDVISIPEQKLLSDKGSRNIRDVPSVSGNANGLATPTHLPGETYQTGQYPEAISPQAAIQAPQPRPVASHSRRRISAVTPDVPQYQQVNSAQSHNNKSSTSVRYAHKAQLPAQPVTPQPIIPNQNLVQKRSPDDVQAYVYDFDRGYVIPISDVRQHTQLEMAQQNAINGYDNSTLVPTELSVQYQPETHHHSAPVQDIDGSVTITNPANQSIIAPDAFEAPQDLQATYIDPNTGRTIPYN